MPLGEEARATLELVVSELMANAVLHGGRSVADPITLTISNAGDRVRVAVHDCGSGFTPDSTEALDPLAPGGRGCVIVDALSEAWGVDSDDDGCTVWCEVDVAGDRAARLV